MDFFKIPVLVFLAFSMGLCLWLVFRPTAAQRYFADGLEKQGQSLGLSVARWLRSVPTWVVSVWGVVALGIEVATALFIIFLV